MPFKPMLFLASIVIAIIGVKMASDLGIKIDTAIKVGKVV
jgi:hypothetical protein